MCKNTSVKDIAKQFGLDAPTLSSWRTLYRNGKLQQLDHDNRKTPALPALLPVIVADPVTSAIARMRIQISLPSGASMNIETENSSFAELGALLALMQQ